MNNFEQQICVSFSKIDFSDLMQELQSVNMAEIRLDLLSLSENEIRQVFSSNKHLLATYRYDQKQSNDWTTTLKTAISSGAEYVDIDIETPEHLKNELLVYLRSFSTKLILSYHNFEHTPDTSSLLNIIETAFKSGADIVKIACMAQHYNDCVNLLSLYKTHRPVLILAMGEKGVVSRLLAPLLGAPFTFAYHEKYETTASGQLSVTEMKSALAILSKNQIRYFGVIGNPITHSKSPEIFKASFSKLNIQAHYLKILSDTITDLNVLFDNGFEAFNITAPFKNDIHLVLSKSFDDYPEPINCIVKTDSNYKVANTDVHGVIDGLKMHGITIREKKVLVIGAGGAAYAAVKGLQESGADLYIVNRTTSKAKALAEKFHVKYISTEKMAEIITTIDIIVNTVSIALPQLLTLSIPKDTVLFDADYKHAPYSVYAIQHKLRYINGLNWLICQAIPAFSLFTNKSNDYNTVKEAVLKPITLPKNRIMMIGLMKTGKTTVGRELAAMMGYSFIDIDNEIERVEGVSINELFAQRGEEYFRKLETNILQKIVNTDNIVISTGGGIVCSETNRKIVKNNCLNVWLFASPSSLARRTDGEIKRPLLQQGSQELIFKKMLLKRMSWYAECADLLIVSEEKKPTHIAKMLYNELIHLD